MNKVIVAVILFLFIHITGYSLDTAKLDFIVEVIRTKTICIGDIAITVNAEGSDFNLSTKITRNNLSVLYSYSCSVVYDEVLFAASTYCCNYQYNSMFIGFCCTF